MDSEGNVHLQTFFNHHPHLATEIIEKSATMWLIADIGGAVLWSNEIFQKFIGYSLPEFTRKDNPVTWEDFSLKDESLKADMEAAAACVRGDYNEYTIRKFYIPKAAAPVFVEVFVRRYPPEGKYEFFVVEVKLLRDEYSTITQSYEQLSRDVMGQIAILSATITAVTANIEGQIEEIKSNTISRIIQTAAEKPKSTAILLMVLGTVILGPRFIELLAAFATAIRNFF